ncbi:hypothetical protein, partial [Flavobacterium sp.]|uniref:hypothetical protein n=1 Tax=Flavobacterium sp. TaxID=239 RepID=UPI002C8350CC
NLFLVLITATANTKNSKNTKNTAVACPKTIVYVNNTAVVCPKTIVYVNNTAVVCPKTIVYIKYTAVVCPKISVYAYKAVATSIKSFFQTYYTDKSGLLFSEKQPITTHYFDKKSQNNNPKIAILTAKIV